MRLTRLDLDRYGPFTDVRLDFRTDADLHIVYGPNEAGKSSALAAITDLLYGFEPRSPANFHHRYEDLRIGGQMLRADGALLSFWRRKRLRNSLADDADAPLDDSLLDPILSGISRQVFLAAFGLNQTGLRDGARQMLAAEGEVGESLFAAASGLKTLISVRSGLESEADALFGSRKSAKRAFYEAHERYDAARKALKEQSLRVEIVSDLDDAIAAQETRVTALAERLAQAGAHRSRIDRVRRVAPLLTRMEQAERSLAALGSLPDLRAGFAAEIEATLARVEAGRETLTRLAAEVTQAGEALKAISVDEVCLAAGEAIAALNEERAALAKAMQDLPRREAEARDLGAALDDLSRRLGLKDRAALASLQPDDITLERIRTLSERRREAELAVAENGRAADRARDSIEKLKGQATALAAGLDPEPLRRRLQAMRPSLAEAAAIGEREEALARRRVSFDERLSRLSPVPANVEALWAWPEPAEDILAAFEQRLTTLAEAMRRDEADAERLRNVASAADRAAEAQAGEGPLVDAAMLARERAARDTLLEAALAEPRPPMLQAYRDAVTRSDELADRRLGQAERLARRDLALRGRDEALATLDTLAARGKAGAEEHARIRAQFQALFEAPGCEAGTPAQMRRFLADLQRLREERSALMDGDMQLGQARRRLAEERPALEAMAQEGGLAGFENQSLASLTRLVEDRLAMLEQGAREARSLADQLAAGRGELVRAQRAEKAAQALLDAIMPDWAAAVVSIGLGERASVQEVAKAAELWFAAQGKVAQLDSVAHRIAGILQDRESFGGRAAALASLLPAGEASEPAQLVTVLMARLASAREADTRRRAAGEHLDRRRAALAEAQTAQELSDGAIAALAVEASVGAAELATLGDALKSREMLRQDLLAARQELARQGDGLDEASLREHVAAIGADRAAGESEAVQAELAALAEEDKQAALSLGELRRRRESIEREAGAAGAAQTLQDARGDLERIARDYIVLKGASLMIEAGLERQLKNEQGPLIARAGALFSAMTQGGFAGIATLYDDDDRLRLAARRIEGGTVAIEGLSEGTRDQLYLALRLANLETMAARREVPPFIGDDLVITFDEMRVAAALQILAAKGSPLQKILFTHHRHVVEIARDRLGAAVDIVALGS